MIWRQFAVLALSLWLLSSPAIACIIYRVPDLRYVREADLVAVGTVMGSEIFDPLPDQYYDEYLVLTIEVDHSIKGKSGRVLRIAWTPQTNSRPAVHVDVQKVLFAANQLGPSDPRSVYFGYDWWDNADWFLAQQNCSDAFIDAWSFERETLWRETINSGIAPDEESPPIYPFALDGPEFEASFDHRSTKQRKRDELIAEWGPLGAIILAIGSALVSNLRSRRKIRQFANPDTF